MVKAIKISSIIIILFSLKIFADHHPAVPRNVIETRIGPFELGKLLPSKYLTCKSISDGNEWYEYYLLFENPNNPNNCLRVQINAECINDSGKQIICTSKSTRKITYIDIETERPYKLFSESESFCKIDISIDELKTSKGIRIGDPLEKVLRIYGPPSYDGHLKNKGFNCPYYIIYTKEKEIGNGRSFDFQIFNDIVIGIRISEGE
jgi:hypothetical protein